MHRKKQIRTQILKALKLSAPYMLTEDVLLTTINFDVRPPVVLSDFEEQLGELETLRQIIRTQDEYRANKVKITTEGRAALTE